MKKFFTIIFLLLSVSFIARAQQINTVEYFFDTDPGFGQGKKITVSGSSLDSNYAFDVTGLSTGIHILYARLKNTNNSWSILYQNTIQVLNGTAGVNQIVAAEYYFDTDPGFGNGRQVTLATADLDSTLNFSVNGLTAGLHTIYVRLKNNNNACSSVYQGAILVLNGTAGSVKITAAEYYFDTDPGFGQGTQIALNNNAIDSIINFNINGLQPGIHSFYVRLKNTDNNWSFANQGNFIVFNGTSGTPQLQTINYFIDSVKNTVSIPLNATALLDTTLSVAIPDNGNDQAILGLRVADQTGSTSNAALSTVSLCDLYKPQGGYRFAQYGGTFTLIDSTQFNDSKKIRWLANNVLLDSSYTINYKLPAANIPGSTVITELTGTGCRVDTVRKTFSMPGVERFAPYVGSYASDFNLNLYGAGLDSTLNVFLQYGSTKVYPYLKIAADGNQHLIAVFDFHDYAKTFGSPEIRDNYTLHVIYPNGYEYVSDPSTPIAMEKQEDNGKIICAWPVLAIRQSCPSNQLIRVPDPLYQSPDSIAEPYFATDLTGPGNMRTGVWNNFTMSITNTGTVVAKGIPFYIMVPASFDIDTAKWHIINPYPGLRDSISIITPIDTIINGRHLQYKLIAMIYPLLAPGETGYFPLRLRTNLTTPYHIYYAAQSRMFGSPMTYLFGPCWGAVFDFGIGFIPGVSCLYAFGNLINDQINFGLKNNHSNGDWFSLGLSYAGTAVSCIPGGGPAAQLAKAASKEMGFVKAGLGELEAVNVFDKGLGVISNANSVASSSDPCSKVKQDPKDKNGRPIASYDPNYIVGNSDYDSAKHYINNYSSQNYMIGFENKPAATADAQHVYIADTLNPAKFYLKTFTMSQFFIGDSIYKLPPYRYQVTKDVAIKYRKDMKVRFTATFDTLKGILQADFFSIDTLGHVFPLDSIAGFLPPDNDGVSGTAGLSYSLYIQNLNTLDTFTNKASIYFDNNAPIVTNAWQNTVDTTRPVGQIVKAILLNDSTAKLIMRGADVGAGLSHYTFYIKSSTDSLFRKIGQGIGDTIVFKGQPNQTYQVFSKSIDHVGNVQMKDSVADISITFTTGPLPVHLLSFTANKEGAKVKLAWTSADEINFSHYEIEKSADGRVFTILAIVNAKGGQLNNNYRLYDENPFAKSNYYRLKQVDNDNKFTYGKIVRIDFDKKYTLNISPDPTHDYVVISGAENFTRIEFIDVSGKTVKQFTSAPGNKFNISSLKPGMYFIRLSSNEDRKVLKLIKQ